MTLSCRRILALVTLINIVFLITMTVICMYPGLGGCKNRVDRSPDVTVDRALGDVLGGLAVGTKGKLCSEHSKVCQCSIGYCCTTGPGGARAAVGYWALARKSMGAAMPWHYEALGLSSNHGVVDQVDNKTTARVCRRCAEECKRLHKLLPAQKSPAKKKDKPRAKKKPKKNEQKKNEQKQNEQKQKNRRDQTAPAPAPAVQDLVRPVTRQQYNDIVVRLL